MVEGGGTAIMNYMGGEYDDMRTEQHHKSNDYNHLLSNSVAQGVSNHNANGQQQVDDNSSLHSTSQVMSIRKIKQNESASLMLTNKRGNKKFGGTAAVGSLAPRPKRNYNKQSVTTTKTSGNLSALSVKNIPAGSVSLQIVEDP